jgi:hypothetical protein
VLVAGIAGFKSWRAVENPSASFLRDWIEHATFTWLVSEDIVSEYKEVPSRDSVFGATLSARSAISLERRRRRSHNKRRVSTIQTTIRFVLVRNSGGPRSLQLQMRRTSLKRSCEPR